MTSIPFVVALVGSAIASATDVRHFKVYNWLSFPLLLSGLIFHTWNLGSSGLFLSVTGIGIPFLLLFPIYAFGIMGAGDVKFASAVGAWLGGGLIVPVLIVGALASGLYSLGLIVFSDGAREAWLNLRQLFFNFSQLWNQSDTATKIETIKMATQRVDRRKRLVPFSAMNAVGVVSTFIWQSSTW